MSELLLNNNINNIYKKPSYFLIAKKLFKKYIIENKNDSNYQYFKLLLQSLSMSEKLLDKSFKLQFYKSPSNQSEIFKPIKNQIKSIESIIKLIKDGEDVKKSLDDLKQRHQEYIDQLISKCNLLKKQKKSEEIKECDELSSLFSVPVILISKDLIEYEISLSDANKISLCSLMGSSGEIYFKVGTDNHKLLPSKENSVFNFYNQLFEIDNFISPTQLLLLNGFPTISNNSNDGESNLTVQASLLAKGKSLKEFLNESNNNPEMLKLIDRESYSAHVISSLLLNQTDYKSDNIFIENQTYKLIGIDNDSVMDLDEMVHNDDDDGWKVQFKNILFTLPLMNEIINSNIRERILKINPYCFVINWLSTSFINECSLISMVEKGMKYKSQSLMNELSLPTFIPKGYSIKLIEKLIIIQKKLKDNKSITLMELFQTSNEYLSLFYQCLENMVPPPPSKSDEIQSSYLYQENLLYNSNLEFKDVINKYSKLHSKSKELFFLKFSKFHSNSSNDNGASNGIENKDEGNSDNFLGSLLEVVKETSYNSTMFNKENEIYQFFSIIYSLSIELKKIESDFEIDDFHSSWVLNSYEILLRLIKFGSNRNLLEFIIKLFKIDLNHPIKSLKESVYHASIYSENENVISQVTLFTELGGSINVKNDNLCPLDISIDDNNFELFLNLLVLGAGKNNIDNNKEFIRYYNSLNNDQKLVLAEKGSIDLLFHNNQRLAWQLSLSVLLPIISKTNQLQPGDVLIRTATEGDRILRKKHVDQIFKKNIETYQYEPIKSNTHGSRCVPFISNEFGHKIYFKFQPQMFGIEIAVNRLTERLLGSCTPSCEIASITEQTLNFYNEPVLLVQNVPGETLYDLFYKSPKTININCFNQVFGYILQGEVLTKPPEISKIGSYNMSQVILSAMIINNADGNLGNFVVSKTNSSSEYRIVSIDNDQSFIPPVSKSIKVGKFGGSKPSLQVESVLFLMDQMLHFVDKNLILEIIKIDINQMVGSWLESLMINHTAALTLFHHVQVKGETFIGIPFEPGMVERLYSKLIRLKMVLQKVVFEKKNITHFELLQFLEPTIATRYQPFLFDQNLTIVEKFKKLKKFEQSTPNSNLSSSVNVSSMLLESRDLPNLLDTTITSNGIDFGPKQALLEFEKIRNQIIKFSSIKDYGKFKQNEQISDGVIEKLLPDIDFSKLTSQQESNFINIIKVKEREIGYINIFNSTTLTISLFKEMFNYNIITKINLVNCKSFDGFKNSIGNIIEFPSLTHLSVEGCPKLNSIKIKSENLKYLNASNCNSLKEFIIESLNLESLILFDTLSNSNLSIVLEFINRFKKLEFLDIGFSKKQQFESLDLFLIYPKLKTLKAKNLIGISRFFIYLPKIQIFEMDTSSSTLMIGEALPLKSLRNLSKIQVNIIGFSIFKNLISKVQNSNYNFTFENNNLIENNINDIKSKLFIQASYCTSVNIIFLDVSDLTNSIIKLSNQLSRFNLRSSNVRSTDFDHSKFILVKIGYEVAMEVDDDQISKKIQDFEQKFRIDDHLQIREHKNIDNFLDELFKLLKKY